MPQTPIVERAFELACSGRYMRVQEIRDQLTVEGYESLGAWFSSDQFKQSLLKACADAPARRVQRGAE